jgi:hypothetical protein
MSQIFKKLRYQIYLNVIIPSSSAFKKILTANSSWGVFRFQRVFRFVKRQLQRRKVPGGLSRGGNMQVTAFAETDM